MRGCFDCRFLPVTLEKGLTGIGSEFKSVSKGKRGSWWSLLCKFCLEMVGSWDPLSKTGPCFLALDQIKSRRMSMAYVRIITAVVCETVSTLKFVFYFS